MRYIIEDIVFKSTGETRTDGKYPDRIGSTVTLMNDVEVGQPLYFKYVKYNNGDVSEEHITRTSTVDDFDYFSVDGHLYIFTRNSIYTFREIPEEDY